MATQRELFFLYSMAHNQSINVPAFAADYLGRVGRADSDGISVGGMITQIIEHFGYHAVLLEETPVEGKIKIDMSDLIQQSMISIAHNYYSVMIHKRFIIALPNPDRVSIVDCANWLYVSVDLDEEDVYDAKNVVAGEPMHEDNQHQEQFVPPHQDPTQQVVELSFMNQDQWAWVQTVLSDLRTEQSIQGIEQARQGAVLDDMNMMMRQLKLHFPP